MNIAAFLCTMLDLANGPHEIDVSDFMWKDVLPFLGVVAFLSLVMLVTWLVAGWGVGLL